MTRSTARFRSGLAAAFAVSTAASLVAAPVAAAPGSPAPDPDPAPAETDAPDDPTPSPSEEKHEPPGPDDSSAAVDGAPPAGAPVVTLEPAEAPRGGGVAGSVVSADDPDAGRATADLEGESLGAEQAGVPERMPPLQAAAWWTLFGAVALGSAGGVFSGIAENREDEAERLAYAYDTDTGARRLYDADLRREYEALLADGVTYQWVARGLVIAGAVALTASITLFAVHAKRKRSRPSAMSLRPRAGGLEVSF